MKLLCVSDHVDPLVYSAAIKRRFGEVELVLSAGHLPMEYLGFISASLNKPVLFVFGNHHLKHLPLFRGSGESTLVDESPGLFRNYFGSTYVDRRVVREKGLIVAGLGGCRRYNRGPNQFTELQMMVRIARIIPRLLFNRLFHGRYLDILLTHAAPFGIHDQPDPTHVGFRSFLWFMERFRPRYLLHGHIHLYDLNARRITHYRGTTVINVYDHYLLEWDK